MRAERKKSVCQPRPMATTGRRAERGAHVPTFACCGLVEIMVDTGLYTFGAMILSPFAGLYEYLRGRRHARTRRQRERRAKVVLMCSLPLQMMPATTHQPTNQPTSATTTGHRGRGEGGGRTQSESSLAGRHHHPLPLLVIGRCYDAAATAPAAPAGDGGGGGRRLPGLRARADDAGAYEDGDDSARGFQTTTTTKTSASSSFASVVPYCRAAVEWVVAAGCSVVSASADDAPSPWARLLRRTPPGGHGYAVVAGGPAGLDHPQTVVGAAMEK